MLPLKLKSPKVIMLAVRVPATFTTPEPAGVSVIPPLTFVALIVLPSNLILSTFAEPVTESVCVGESVPIPILLFW